MSRFSEEPFVYSKFSGIRNNTPAENFAPEDLQAAVNCDVDNDQGIMTRNGQILRNAGTYHSLSPDWIATRGTCLLVDGTTLKRLRATSATAYAMDTVRTGLTSGARLSQWLVNDCIYWCNGFETGVVQAGIARTFGIAPPSSQPVAAAIGGGLPAGRYRYAMTFLRNDGQESGTGLAATIDLTGQGGIGFSQIPVSDDPTVTDKAIYVTATNGEVMYQAIVIPNTDTTVNYLNAGYDLRLPLNTQFGCAAPIGHMLAWFKGKMIVAQGNVLWPSVSGRYELFMLDKEFLELESEINMLAPVEDGIFIGADRTYFMSGLWNGVPIRTVVAGYPAIPGTLAYEQGDYVGDGIAGRVAYWSSPRGHCIGANGGQFKNITESRYSFPSGQRGAGIVRQSQGINQYLAVIEGTGVANNAFS